MKLRGHGTTSGADMAQLHGLSNEVLNAHLAGSTHTERQVIKCSLERMAMAGEAMRQLA